MSYARFGCEGSDVYLFPTKEGFTCCACRLYGVEMWWVTDNVEQYLFHMHEHRRAGHCVPDSAFSSFAADFGAPKEGRVRFEGSEGEQP